MGHLRTVLMVDDDDDDRMLFNLAISTIDPRIKSIQLESCKYTLGWIREQEQLPEIVFLDLNIPVMGGFDCLEIIRNTDEWRDIPVIIYSTSSHSSDIEKAFALGASGFLKKPDDFELMCACLRRILSHDFNNDEYPVII